MKQSAYKNYLIALLVTIGAFSIVDRLALSLVQEQIKTDLDLTDTQLGLLTGVAYTLFYAVLGIPIARWADRGNRVTIIAAATASWSIAVAAIALVGGFVQLILLRIATAVGEAGFIPPAFSLIADFFGRSERPRAFSRYWLCTLLAVLVGYFVAGWLDELVGWRLMFVILAAPGVALAVIAALSLQEPRAGGRSGRDAHYLGQAQSTLRDAWSSLWRNQTFRGLLFGNAIATFFNYGIMQWQATFFIRSFGLHSGIVGTWFTVIGGGCGLLGTWLGGELSFHFAANNEPRQLRFVALAYCLYALISVGAFLSTSYVQAFVLMGIAAIAITMANGSLFATIQSTVPSRLRAMSTALIFASANLLGGFGPLTAGTLSDVFRTWAGNESLRYALVVLWPGYLIAGWYFWRASLTVSKDLKQVLSDDFAPASGDTIGEGVPTAKDSLNLLRVPR